MILEDIALSPRMAKVFRCPEACFVYKHDHHCKILVIRQLIHRYISGCYFAQIQELFIALRHMDITIIEYCYFYQGSQYHYTIHISQKYSSVKFNINCRKYQGFVLCQNIFRQLQNLTKNEYLLKTAPAEGGAIPTKVEVKVKGQDHKHPWVLCSCTYQIWTLHMFYSDI